MEINKSNSILIILLMFVSGLIQAKAYYSYYCPKESRCSDKYITCPYECPSSESSDPHAKVCHIDCNKPICKAGSGCYDPRFIGGDGRVFYFHGKSNEHFALVSDSDLQINARFIGHRPAGRSRHYTWIQALGILFHSQTFSLEATKSAQWNDDVDLLKFTHNGKDLILPEGSLSSWKSPEGEIRVERIAHKNSVMLTVRDFAEILVNVVPVTREDDRIHNYQLPNDDCFAHLEVQFRFVKLSGDVEGVLGRTYRPDFENPAKVGVAMPVVGGEDKYKTSSLFDADCASCGTFLQGEERRSSTVHEYGGTLDCTKFSFGLGIVCKK